MTLGYQNNNPGNIRLISQADTPFMGEIRPNITAFRKFESMPYGYRALMKNLQALINSGKDTIWKIIHAWAPFGDGNNNPDNYSKTVQNRSGINYNKTLNPADIDSLIKISAAISFVENGIEPNQSDILKGAQLLNASGSVSSVPNVSSSQPTNWKRYAFIALGSAALLTAIVAYNEKSK